MLFKTGKKHIYLYAPIELDNNNKQIQAVIKTDK